MIEKICLGSFDGLLSKIEFNRFYSEFHQNSKAKKYFNNPRSSKMTGVFSLTTLGTLSKLEMLIRSSPSELIGPNVAEVIHKNFFFN